MEFPVSGAKVSPVRQRAMEFALLFEQEIGLDVQIVEKNLEKRQFHPGRAEGREMVRTEAGVFMGSHGKSRIPTILGERARRSLWQ